MAVIPKAIQLPGKKKIQVIGPSLLEKLNLIVAHEMDTVWFEIGGTRLSMDYPTALKFGFMLRTHAKQAKKFAGDHAKVWHTEAVLSDAEENYKRGW